MKKGLFLAFALSMGMMVGCGDSSSDSVANASENGGKNTSDNNGGTVDAQAIADTLTPFFPEGYKADDVVAWFATEVTTDVEKDRTKIYVDAVFLFKDGTFVATESKVKIKPDGVTSSKGVAAEGEWAGSQEDFENGSFEIAIDGDIMRFEIKDGVFTIAPEGGESMKFTLMDSNVPKASKAGETKEDVKDDPKDDPKDPEETSEVTAFFPEGYDADKVVAWYASDKVSVNDKGRQIGFVEAIFLFDDGSFVATDQKILMSNNVATYENAIAGEGTWEGYIDDFANAVVQIYAEEWDMPIEVKNGKFTITQYENVSLTFTLVKTGVPEADKVTVQQGNHDMDDADGTAEQLGWAKKIIEGSKAKASTIATFEISEPTWEQNKINDKQYLATFTIKVTLSEGQFYTEEMEYPTLAIGQYPVHAIESAEDNLPEQWNNNNWEIKDAKVVGNTMTATMTEKIDNLKVARAYVFVTNNPGMDLSIQYSEAFLIVPPGSEDAVK
jgi:hypothetical protein